MAVLLSRDNSLIDFCDELMHLNNILILPDELISNILKGTDYKTVVACRRSCHRLKEIVETSSALQYIVELAATGMCDGTPDSGVVPAERLTRLRMAQDAWKSSAWSTVDCFPYSKGMSPYPVMTSGNLVVFRSSTSRVGELLLLRFPSEARGIPSKLWHLDLSSYRVEALCADDSQDLIAFSCLWTIHIRTLSSGCVHPLTSTAGSIHSPSIFGGFNLHIHGDRVLVLGNSSGLCGLVWDWKTGEQIAKIPFTTSCFSFLDRSHVISMSYDIADTVERLILLQVATLPDVPGDPAPCPTYHFMLELPILIPPYFTELHANALPTDWPSSDQRGWFHANTDERLMVFELGSPTADGLAIAFTQHTLHVPRDVFLSHITAHGRSESSEFESEFESEPVVVPWHEWAPGHTRLTEDPNVSQRHLGLRHPCGMRALGEPHHLLLLDRGVLRITDYHPRRVARAHASRRAPYHNGNVNGNDNDNDNDNDDHSHTAGGGSYDGTGDGKDDPAKEGNRDRERHERSEPDHHHASTSPSLPWLRRDPIPYVEKDIPLPDSLLPRLRSAHVRCVLGEDVVLLFEFSVGDLESPAHTIEKIYFHPI